MSIIQALRAMGIGPNPIRRHSISGHPKGDEFGRCASGAVCRRPYLITVTVPKLEARKSAIK